jgi:hypothetical protein
MSVIVLVQGTPHPERKEALAEYQQTARTRSHHIRAIKSDDLWRAGRNGRSNLYRSMVALWVTLMFVFAMSWTPAIAQDSTTVSGTSGGNGGGPFRLSCPSGMAMIGLRARHGAWVDSLSPICAIWVRNNRTLGEIDEQPGTGGGGGGPGWMRCQGPRGAVVGLYVWQAANSDRSVGRIYLSCGDYEQPTKFANKLPGGADGIGQSIGGPRVELRCGANEVAVGLYGRSGAFIDRVGLLCQRPRR